MIINTYSVAQDSSFGNSLVYDLSAIDESWTYIRNFGSSSIPISDFNNYNQLLFFIPVPSSSTNKISIVNFYNGSNAIRFTLTGSTTLSIAVIINKLTIPTDVTHYSSYASSISVFGK